MFGWGSKKDGFEWHKHVRTTIKLRREDRKARFIDARDVAADGLRYAGRLGVNAGSSGAASVRSGAASAARATAAGLRVAGGIAAATASSFAGRAIAASLATARAIGRGTVTLGQQIGDGVAAALPGLQKLGVQQRRAMGLAALAIAVGSCGYLGLRPTTKSLTGLARLNPFAAQVLEGRATAIDGDLLRVGGTVVKLAGIEAPLKDQKCVIGKKRWACGEAALAALQKLIRSRNVKCEVGGTDDNGVTVANCLVLGQGEPQDIAAVLVLDGAVFAEGGIFQVYGGAEAEAATRKVGLWRGEAERPAEYRARLWDAAAKTAPEGCPIKALSAGDSKTYLLPWQPDYGAARVREARGERWFCSEAEAQAEGWVAASR